MEPVTHILTGACLSRAGLNRRAAYATAAMAIAAEFPDIDTLWSLRGPIAGFEHHRGITHTFVGIPFEAALLLIGIISFHHLRSRRAGKPPIAPVRWATLYLLLLVALLSHLLLDYTNNYGVRPFFPFNTHWYAGSIVFIFDPLLFLLLLGGLLVPVLFGLVGREVGARKQPFAGRGWARAALLGMLLLWSVRWFEHGNALRMAQMQTLRAPAPATSSLDSYLAQASSQDQPAPADQRPLLIAQRALASPDPLSAFRWYTATDFGSAIQLGIADTRLGNIAPGDVFAKPPPTPALQAASTSLLGRVYLDWSPMPLLSQTSGVPDAAGISDLQPGAAQTVTFADPRFMGDTPILHRQGAPPLTGQVVLSSRNQVLAQGMDGNFGR